MSRTWPKPQSRNVGSYGDLQLYREVLRFAESEGVINQALLTSEESGLGQRVRGLLLVKRVTPTAAYNLVLELQAYGWIRKQDSSARNFELTKEGLTAAQFAGDTHAFRRALLQKMQERFVIPGWFIERLHQINKFGGDVILPGPRKDWRPAARPLDSDDWTVDLDSEVRESHVHNLRVLASGFPVPIDQWAEAVKDAWGQIVITRSKSKTFAPRGRLARAMRRAAIDLLFDNCPFGSTDTTFAQTIHPIPPRSFQSWCPLLEALELIGYTDSHPDLIGRLIFPCAAFRKSTDNSAFENTQIESSNGGKLCLFQPKLHEGMTAAFENALWSVYSRFSEKVRTRYVSAQDVRDEVCRLLRLSSRLFDVFLENAVRNAARRNEMTRGIMIALESDVQPNQQTASGLLRRPVYVDGIAHSLISISVPQTH